MYLLRIAAAPPFNYWDRGLVVLHINFDGNDIYCEYCSTFWMQKEVTWTEGALNQFDLV